MNDRDDDDDDHGASTRYPSPFTAHSAHASAIITLLWHLIISRAIRQELAYATELVIAQSSSFLPDHNTTRLPVRMIM